MPSSLREVAGKAKKYDQALLRRKACAPAREKKVFLAHGAYCGGTMRLGTAMAM